MAKVQFSKFGLKEPITEDALLIFNEVEVNVKSYLPINDKLVLVQDILNDAQDDNKFYNIGKIKVAQILNSIRAYTDITFTDKQLEKPAELYDIIITSGLWDEIVSLIGNDYDTLTELMWDTIKSIYKYRNSAMGIMDTLAADYKNLDFDTKEIHDRLSNPEDLTLLKDIVNKLG